jgi:CRISPR/Cas system-associated exonuclease Cas4 (RecB family)
MKPNKIASWSFSRYSTYQQCPRKAKYIFVDKHKEPGNAAMQRGSDIHAMAENFINGRLETIPGELMKFETLLKDLNSQKREKPDSIGTEKSWNFRQDWSETVWNDWSGCWLRLKVDCVINHDNGYITVIDWKTGKFKEQQNDAYMEQLGLYALGAFLTYPDTQNVECKLVYLDAGIEYPAADNVGDSIYARSELSEIKKTWEKRVIPMLADTSFNPRPSVLCKWCHFGQSGVANGGLGLCEY